MGMSQCAMPDAGVALAEPMLQEVSRSARRGGKTLVFVAVLIGLLVAALLSPGAEVQHISSQEPAITMPAALHSALSLPVARAGEAQKVRGLVRDFERGFPTALAPLAKKEARLIIAAAEGEKKRTGLQREGESQEVWRSKAEKSGKVEDIFADPLAKLGIFAI